MFGSRKISGSRLVRAVAAGLLMVVAAAAQSGTTRISVAGDVQAALLEKKVIPVYPPLARAARVEGAVRLQVIIGKNGSVVKAERLSGHALLARPATDAVCQWRYKPTLSHGESVEVVTTVEIIFKL